MKKIVTLSSLLLGVIFLAGCGQQPVSQTKPTAPAPVAQQKEQPITTPATQTTVPTETLNYCGKSFVAEKVEINEVDIVNRILQLTVAKASDNCTNFEQINNIAVLKIIKGNTTRIVLYESKSLTETDRQLSTDKQLEKIRSNTNYPQVNEYEIKADSIVQISSMDDQGVILGKIK